MTFFLDAIMEETMIPLEKSLPCKLLLETRAMHFQTTIKVVLSFIQDDNPPTMQYIVKVEKFINQKCWWTCCSF